MQFAQEMLGWAKQRVAYESLDSMHRRVEMARVWDGADSVLSEVPDEPKFEDEISFHILKAALLKQARRYKTLEKTISAIPDTMSNTHVRLLHRYELLPVTVLTPQQSIEYFQRSLPERIKMLENRAAESMYRDYLLGRLYWKTEQYPSSLQPLKRVNQQVQAGIIPWAEAQLYRASSLSRLEEFEDASEVVNQFIELYTDYVESIDESKQRFVEVEGLWSTGRPLMSYLKTWKEKIRNKSVDDWYKPVGHAKQAIPYYRFFNGDYSNEPLGRFIAEQIKQATGADFAVVNHKGIRAGLNRGTIRHHELHLLLPFNNPIQTAVIEKPDTASSDTAVRNLKRPLRELLKETFFRARFSFGTGDPLSFSEGVSTNNTMIDRFQFQFEVGDTITLAAGQYAMRKINEFSLGFLQKSVSDFPQTDRELMGDYIRRVASIDTASLVAPNGQLPEASLLNMNVDQMSGLSWIPSSLIVSFLSTLLGLVIGIAILISLFRHWSEALQHARWGIYFGIGYTVLFLLMAPWWMDATRPEFVDMFQGLFYGVIALGSVIAFIQIFVLTCVGFFYAESLELPACPVLRGGDSPARFPWNPAVRWTIGLTVTAVVYSLCLFLLIDPAVPKSIQQFKEWQHFGIENIQKSSLLLVLNFVLLAFGEEITYRLGIQNFLAYGLNLGKRYYWAAIWITAGLWTIGHAVHLDPSWVKILQVLPFGVALGYLYRHYGLEMCVVSHGAFNILMVYLGPHLLNPVT